jgi:hypothetical protein
LSTTAWEPSLLFLGFRRWAALVAARSIVVYYFSPESYNRNFGFKADSRLSRSEPFFFGSGGFLFQRCNLVCPALIPEAFRLLLGNEMNTTSELVVSEGPPEWGVSPPTLLSAYTKIQILPDACLPVLDFFSLGDFTFFNTNHWRSHSSYHWHAGGLFRIVKKTGIYRSCGHERHWHA